MLRFVIPLLLSGASLGQASDVITPGISPSLATRLAEFEAQAVAVPNPEAARDLLRRLTEEPHEAGTPAGYETAVLVRDSLREWGWDAEFAEYEVLLNEPDGMPSVTIVRPDRVELKVIEDPLPHDKDSASPDAWPAFHGYGVSGDVTGQIVYVNYGTVADFDTLESLGINVAGKIVLARYGAIFRGLKVLNAQRRGAIGILIYSDPIDDGYAQGDVYPNGPYRPPSAIQRGSVQFLSLGPGDPSTPNGPSVKGAERLPFDRYFGFPLAGKAPLDPLNPASSFSTVHPAEVDDWEEETGLDRNEYFAAIPSLPMSYEAAHPIFEALAGPEVPTGWQGGLPLAYHVGPGPVEVRLAVRTKYSLKTIYNVIATLRGEIEPDRWVMVGNHRDAWTYGAVDPGSGTAATLEACRALGETYKAGWRPRRTIVYASWDAEEYGLVGSTEWADEHRDELDTNVDFSGRYGVYHSIYDNFTWMERFGDPGFIRHATAAKLYTLVLMRAASAEVAPLTFTPYGEALASYLDGLRVMVARKALARDEEPPIRFDGLAELSQAIRNFQDQAGKLDEATATLASRNELPDDEALSMVNDALLRVERAFLIDGGLPNRPFFRHAIYAPGLTTGYASWPLPGVRQAIEETNQGLLDDQIPLLIDRLEAATEAMTQATHAAQNLE